MKSKFTLPSAFLVLSIGVHAPFNMSGWQGTVGPCGTSGPCGPAEARTASINCGICNSGGFVLSCTCCELSVGMPPQVPCQKTNICTVQNGSCSSRVCAKCTNQQNPPNGPRNSICFPCAGFSCPDLECSPGGGGFRAAKRLVNQLTSGAGDVRSYLSEDQSQILPVAEITSLIDGKDLLISGFKLIAAAAPVAVAEFGFEVRSDDGQVQEFGYRIDQSFSPKELASEQSMCAVRISKQNPANLYITAKTTYVLFADGTSAGDSNKEAADLRNRKLLSGRLNALRSAIEKVSSATPGDSRKDLGAAEPHGSLVTLLESEGTVSLQRRLTELVALYERILKK
jgi:hypothetical protein